MSNEYASEFISCNLKTNFEDKIGFKDQQDIHTIFKRIILITSGSGAFSGNFSLLSKERNEFCNYHGKNKREYQLDWQHQKASIIRKMSTTVSSDLHSYNLFIQKQILVQKQILNHTLVKTYPKIFH